jgi:hypothetical protein
VQEFPYMTAARRRRRTFARALLAPTAIAMIALVFEAVNQVASGRKEAYQINTPYAPFVPPAHCDTRGVLDL